MIETTEKIESQQLCTFLLGQQMFGVDVKCVQEVIRYQEMTEVPLAHESLCGLINLRGQIVTAIDLRKRLGLEDRESDVLPINVIIRTDDGAISLLVDRIGDVQQIDNSEFELPPETMPAATRKLIRGAYKLKDRLLLVLDTNQVVDIASVPESLAV